MIFCTLDDKVAYPSTSDKIKVTYENQFIKDSGSYTYDITFPMAIAANRKIFGNVQRIDVKKNLADFETCRLYAGNRLVMSGKGTVTSITPDKVKVQIVGGKSRIKYNSKFQNHYIDKIDLGTASLPGKDISKLALYNTERASWLQTGTNLHIGVKGEYTFCPIWDETNDMLANKIRVSRYGDQYCYAWMLNSELAVQPNLMYVLKKVLEYEGYKIESNEYDCDPWNRLYVASAFKTMELRHALPHWTVYTFIEEVSNLLNASFDFDDSKRTVRISKGSGMLSQDTVEYECEDSFSVEVNKDEPLEILAASNIEYNLGDSSNRGDYEIMTQKVLDSFEVLEVPNVGIETYTKDWTEKRRRQTIFEDGRYYYIYAVDSAEQEKATVRRVGIWTPIVRNKDSDDYTDLNICPAAIFVKNIDFGQHSQGILTKQDLLLLSNTNDKEAEAKASATDDDGNEYVSVQDALDDDSVLEENEDDQEAMPVFFLSEYMYDSHLCDSYGIFTQIMSAEKNYDDYTRGAYRMPVAKTDSRLYIKYPSCYASMALVGIEDASIAELHKDIDMDAVSEYTIKFLTDDIPDPTKIFIFHNKRYVCSKVEMEVTNDGIDRVKTGYFYEIL